MSFDKLEADARARVGRVLNEKWTLESVMGVGGMAAVYRARHRNGARAAVKILHPELARRPEVRERFLREGYAANRVEHRNAVQVLDDDIVHGGEDDGAAYLVMELLEGESLEQRAAHPPEIEEQELLTITSGVLSVLEAAHEHGVVHRDLKPDNIFLAKDPDDGRLRVKVLDFGLACLVDADRTTLLGLALGTPSYMSPEQAAGRSEEIDGRTDLFALGATAFRILTHRRIHEAEDTLRLVGKMANDPAPPIRSVMPTVSEGVAAVIDRALAFRREDRYATAADMRADVDALRDVVDPSSNRMAVAPATTSRRLLEAAVEEPDEAAAETTETPPEVTEAPAKRRTRSILPIVTVLLWAGIMLVYWRSRETPVAETPVGDAHDGAVAVAVPEPERETSTSTSTIGADADDAASFDDAASIEDAMAEAASDATSAVADASVLVEAAAPIEASAPIPMPVPVPTPRPAPLPHPPATTPKRPVHPPAPAPAPKRPPAPHHKR